MKRLKQKRTNIQLFFFFIFHCLKIKYSPLFQLFTWQNILFLFTFTSCNSGNTKPDNTEKLNLKLDSTKVVSALWKYSILVCQSVHTVANQIYKPHHKLKSWKNGFFIDYKHLRRWATPIFFSNVVYGLTARRISQFHFPLLPDLVLFRNQQARIWNESSEKYPSLPVEGRGGLVKVNSNIWQG